MASEVRGPVAITTSASAGISVTSSRRSSMRGWPAIAAVTRAPKRSRSRARALPAGTEALRAMPMISDPKASISRLRRPAAWKGSSLRSELLHTSSARSPVLCAGVPLTGRISWSTTGTPRSASCQAHSEPASPPPMMWTGEGMRGSINAMLLIDTDNAAGSPRGDVDDAFAIAALLRSGLPVAALSSVAGNTSEALADRNNRTLGALCGYGGSYLRGVQAGDVPDRIDRADLGGPLRFV